MIEEVLKILKSDLCYKVDTTMSESEFYQCYDDAITKLAQQICQLSQERVERIVGFIEQYKEPHEHMGVVDFVGVPLDEWESFKEGVK